MFKKKRCINLSYEMQGYIQFLCYTINRQSKGVQERVKSLCREIAGEEWKVLYEVLTNPYKTLERIARDSFIYERRLSVWRAVFFETYAKEYL